MFFHNRSAGYVELMAEKVGVKAPRLSPRQLSAWQTRWSIGLVSLVLVAVPQDRLLYLCCLNIYVVLHTDPLTACIFHFT